MMMSPMVVTYGPITSSGSIPRLNSQNTADVVSGIMKIAEITAEITEIVMIAGFEIPNISLVAIKATTPSTIPSNSESNSDAMLLSLIILPCVNFGFSLCRCSAEPNLAAIVPEMSPLMASSPGSSMNSPGCAIILSMKNVSPSPASTPPVTDMNSANSISSTSCFGYMRLFFVL